MWRCPHCGTPQAETARCWVCRRSSTACATCRNFRRSVAGQLGYCGLDRKRVPLRGDEIRACWESSAPPIEVPVANPVRSLPPSLEVDDDRTSVRTVEFVEVPTAAQESRRRIGPKAEAGQVDAAAIDEAGNGASLDDGPLMPPSEPGWSLWGEQEV
jgi:hypothetical protein